VGRQPANLTDDRKLINRLRKVQVAVESDGMGDGLVDQIIEVGHTNFGEHLGQIGLSRSDVS
jgi:hypothetical protein